MLPRKLKVSILPYLVAIATILFCFLVWVVVDDFLPYYYHRFIHVHPGAYLLLVILFSIIVGIVVGFVELMAERNQAIASINLELQREILERKAAEDTRQKLEMALLQGQKLQAIGTLAGGIAHDFNNILYAIIGYVELTLEDLPKDDQRYKNLTKVLAGAERGQELVSRILAFGRRQTHDVEPVNVTQMIESVLSLLKPTIPASVEIKTHYGFNGDITANKTQIHQVLVNLITNAVDAMNDDGTITVTTSLVPIDDPALRNFPQIFKQPYCRIDVKDTGSGMDKGTINRIFEPFFTTKEVGKGTGLGLSIVHTIIKDHRGEITVASELGKGTTFSILLPEHLTE